MRNGRLLTLAMTSMGLLLLFTFMSSKFMVACSPEQANAPNKMAPEDSAQRWVVEGNTITATSEQLRLTGPDGWEILEDPDDGTVSIISPATDTDDPFRENVTLAVHPHMHSTSFDAYFDETIDQLASLQEDYVEESRGAWNPSSAKGRYVVYRRTRNGTRYKHVIWSVPVEDNVLTMSATGLDADFDEYAAIFNTVADSVTIGNRR